MLAILLLALKAVASECASVTFTVGTLGTVDPAGLQLAGSFQGWNTTSMQLSLSPDTYSLTLNLPPGQYEFKFLNGDTWEEVPQDCVSGEYGNRVLDVPVNESTEVQVCLGSCVPCAEIPRCKLFNCPVGVGHKADTWNSAGSSTFACCEPHRLDKVEVLVRSAGMSDGNRAEFWAGGEMIYGTGTRGLTVLVLSQNATTQQVQTFDTHGDDSSALVSFLQAVAPRQVVLIAAVDEASAQLSQVAKSEISRLGGTGVQDFSYRGSYALIGVKDGTALAEDVLPSGNGFAVAAALLTLPDVPAPAPAPHADTCEAHSAEAPVSGHVTPDGNFVLDAGCKYKIRNPSQVTACLDGSWLVATGSSNSQLMWNTIVMMLAPAEADVMRPGRFGSRDLMDIVIEQGRIIYINTVRSSEELCRQVDTMQAAENDAACRELYAQQLAGAPEHSSNRIRVTFFMSFFWPRTGVAADLIETNIGWASAEVSLLVQVCAWYLVCNSMQCDCCTRPELRYDTEDAVFDVFSSEMDAVLTRLEPFCSPGGRAGLRGCTVATNSWSPAGGALGATFLRFNAEVTRAMGSRMTASFRYLDVFELGASMPDETVMGHGSQLLHQWTWQILLGGFCSASAASTGLTASFSGPMCFAEQYDLQKCPTYHDACLNWNNCVTWQCGNTVLCTLSSVTPVEQTTTITATPVEQTTTSTSTSTGSVIGSYLAVDGGENRACRGASASDNNPNHYTKHELETLESCQHLCSSMPECVGIEYSSGRCEIWTRTQGIQASIPLRGFMCYRKAEYLTTTATATPDTTFAGVDGGFDRACRGQNQGDNKAEYFTVASVASLNDCKQLCIQTSGCTGIEFSGSRCEVWTREEGIGATVELSGFICLKYAPQARQLSLLV